MCDSHRGKQGEVSGRLPATRPPSSRTRGSPACCRGRGRVVVHARQLQKSTSTTWPLVARTVTDVVYGPETCGRVAACTRSRSRSSWLPLVRKRSCATRVRAVKILDELANPRSRDTEWPAPRRWNVPGTSPRVARASIGGAPSTPATAILDSVTSFALPKRRLIGALLAVALVLALPASAPGAESAAQQLAAEYSPVLSLQPQPKRVRPGRGVPAHDCRHRPRQAGRRTSRSEREAREARADVERPVGSGAGLLPRLSGQSDQPRLRLRAAVPALERRPAAERLRARGDGPVVPWEARCRVLVLLHVQRLHRLARERLGDGPGRLPCPERCGRSANRPLRGRPVSARGRGAVSVDRHQAPEGRHAPGHLRRHGVARELLRPRAVPRARRARGLRLRRHSHGHATAGAEDRPVAERSVVRI